MSFDAAVFQMWFVLLLTVAAAFVYAREKYPIEVTSVGILTILLLLGQFFPVIDETGRNKLDAAALLSGFANPALVAVLALLVMGQALTQTDALRPVTNFFITENRVKAWFSAGAILLLVLGLSAFVNNTPLVIIAIPVIQALVASSGLSSSKLMMPLSFAAILGGMMTLVGSSTNMLVSGTLVELGYQELGFFQFVVPGAILASVGFIYAIAIVPQLLKDRESFTDQFVDNDKEFIAELDVAADSRLAGMEFQDGNLPALSNLKIVMIQRRGEIVTPPFDGQLVKPEDIIIVVATREALADVLSRYPGFLISENTEDRMLLAEKGETTPVSLEVKVAETRVLAEVMITPASRLIDMSLEHAAFQRQFGVIVLGIQRRARAIKRKLGRVRLEAGDVLLVSGSRGDVDSMRSGQDLIVLSGSKRELPVTRKAPIAIGVMISVIGLAAFGVISIPVAAIAGVSILVATDCLNVQQATRAIDRKIFLLIGSMLALGTALQNTGGAKFIAESLLDLPFADVPFAMTSVLFIVIAIVTNILSNNACAIIFTPIAVSLAEGMGVDPFIFAVTVVMAANCSFASPIGYKTNLLVMGPGHYRFSDFMKAGIPLIVILWVVYMFLAKFYFGL